MRSRVFVLVPADVPHGPVKGAYALANALAEERQVTLATLRPGSGAHAWLAPGVQRVCLQAAETEVFRWPAAVRAYRRLLSRAGSRADTASISMCLSADVVNSCCRREALTCASVRGNLFVNYRLDYGPVGLAVAAAHLAMLRRFDHVTSMSAPMAKQVRQWSGRDSTVIGNFVNEQELEPLRASTRSPGPARLIFVGSLSARKRPALLLQALSACRSRGLSATLDVLGTGPLEPGLRQLASQMKLERLIRFHGFVPEPGPWIAASDLFVLPSLSEGISRAALEALHLGVPCVLRAADGNAELIQAGRNGILFKEDRDLPDAVLGALQLQTMRSWPRSSLLPPAMRQAAAKQAYAELLDAT